MRTSKNQGENCSRFRRFAPENSLFPSEVPFTFPKKRDILSIVMVFLIYLHEKLRLNLCSFAVATHTPRGDNNSSRSAHDGCDWASQPTPREGTITLPDTAPGQGPGSHPTPRKGTITNIQRQMLITKNVTLYTPRGDNNFFSPL